jgi:hypothetical protein
MFPTISLTFHNQSDDKAQRSELIPRARRIAVVAASWTARVSSIPITAGALAGIAQYLTRKTGTTFPPAGVFAACLAIAAANVIAWWREGAGRVLLVAGISGGIGATFSSSEPFRG